MKRRFCAFWGLTLGLFSCFGEVKPADPGLKTTPPLVQALSVPSQEDSLIIVAAGDNLIHESIILAAYREGVYRFDSIYAGIKALIEPADIAFINQETPLAGERFGYSRGLSFNTPQVMGKTLADAGFDVVSHANNHALDKGEAGLTATLDLWDSLPAVQSL